jgi:hypothetical protein
MKHSPPHNVPVFGLTRKSTGLTPAHIGLIKLLAARAVADYLREVESGAVGGTTTNVGH